MSTVELNLAEFNVTREVFTVPLTSQLKRCSVFNLQIINS